ncbi:SPOR domain-containing protein [Gemmobacter serpentinus]|uniref:SPOR domain-containing protein n=1 Tax=Gemmobacter serpentinus TaxID=2652247 RepID=UPI00186571F6|nr:SPOR domain-containing protein [Gemmobacter serpentinus]
MLRKFMTAAVLAAVSGITVSNAQTVGQIGGPKELPPAGFKGQMYVDSRGCVFLRAGLNGSTNWVPRVSRNRKALCGYPPTLAAMAAPVEIATPAEMAAAVASAAPTPAPAPRATGKPLNTVATLTTPPAIRATGTQRPVDPALARALPAPIMPPAAVMMAQAPVASRIAPPVAQVAPPSQGVEYRQAGPGPGQIGCYASAPVPKVVALSNGGSAVLCTKGDGTLNGLRAPIYGKVAMGEGQRVGAGLYPPAGQKVARGNVSADQAGVSGRATVVSRGTNVVTYVEPRVVVAQDVVVVPQGYKRAWTDDRLNPYRGLGTAQGQYDQDQVWTRDVPAQLVPQGQPRVVVSTKGQPTGRVRVSSGGSNLHVSSKSEPRVQLAPAPQVQVQVAPRGGYYVQVGTFGVPANAEGAKARLRAAGLPVGSAKAVKGGKALQMVMAGPFADAGSAQSALSMARSAGFGDAYIR